MNNRGFFFFCICVLVCVGVIAFRLPPVSSAPPEPGHVVAPPAINIGHHVVKIGVMTDGKYAEVTYEGKAETLCLIQTPTLFHVCMARIDLATGRVIQ